MIKPEWKWTQDIEDEILGELPTDGGLVVHVCSGTSGIGDIRIDRYFERGKGKDPVRRNPGQPNVKADMNYLPIRSGIAAATICDPPYSRLARARFNQHVEELVRITKPGGKVIFLAPWIIQHSVLIPVRLFLRRKKAKNFPSYKILSISIKGNAQMGDF